MKKYCAYVFKKGVNKGATCTEVCHLQTNFCKKHTKVKITQTTSPSHLSMKNTATQNTQKDKIAQNTQSSSSGIQIKDKKKSSSINVDKESSRTIIHINKLVNKKLQEENIREKILNLPTNDTNKSVIFKHYNNMKRTDQNSTEYYKNQLFVDMSLSYPWEKLYNINDNITNKNIPEFLQVIKQNLDNEIYGMESVKNEILNVVCKFITNPQSNRNNIALCGAAGVGKSKFIKVLSETLRLPMKVISLGGIKDSSFFLGHGYVYVESGPGKILQNIIDSKINNPILYFDELDKVSETDNGKDIFSFLCYLTDPTQNNRFTDHYFYGMQFDLSKVFYVFTFNDIDKIDKILLDRLNIISVDTPSDEDITKILECHCIPEIIKNIGIQKNIQFPQSSIKLIIDHCKSSIDKSVTSGVREYYRIIEKMLLELNKSVLLEENSLIASQIVIDEILFRNLFEKIKGQLIIKDDSYRYNHMYI
jgi:ATP-dependent Lon protease